MSIKETELHCPVCKSAATFPKLDADKAIIWDPKYGVSVICTSCDRRFLKTGVAADIFENSLNLGERIVDDLSCPSCSYNLKMQSAGGHCPECGQEVRSYHRAYRNYLELENRGENRMFRFYFGTAIPGLFVWFYYIEYVSFFRCVGDILLPVAAITQLSIGVEMLTRSRVLVNLKKFPRYAKSVRSNGKVHIAVSLTLWVTVILYQMLK